MVLSKESSCLSQATQGYSYRLGKMMSQEGWSIGIDREGRREEGIKEASPSASSTSDAFCLLFLTQEVFSSPVMSHSWIPYP